MVDINKFYKVLGVDLFNNKASTSNRNGQWLLWLLLEVTSTLIAESLKLSSTILLIPWNVARWFWKPRNNKMVTTTPKPKEGVNGLTMVS